MSMHASLKRRNGKKECSKLCAKVISYLQMLCFYDFTEVTELKVMKYKFEKYERLIAIQNN